jgi:hypothetical protein
VVARSSVEAGHRSVLQRWCYRSMEGGSGVQGSGTTFSHCCCCYTRATSRHSLHSPRGASKWCLSNLDRDWPKSDKWAGCRVPCADGWQPGWLVRALRALRAAC